MDKKKPYTPPTVTDHGKVANTTQGMLNDSYETWGRRSMTDDPKNPSGGD